MSDAQTCVVFGTDTGNTEFVAERIMQRLDNLGLGVDMHDIEHIDVDRILEYEFVILGIPTWDFGGIQGDWEELEERLSAMDLSGKVVALYGLGDQNGYSEYFVDAMGWLHERLQGSNASFVGSWPTEGYDFDSSRAANADKTRFCGLALDEDNQWELTDARLDAWIDQILSEYVDALNSGSRAESALG
ncbi:MAG: flavodoxin [Actinomycetota bacterium]